jgi:hypothetical protein
MEYLMLIPLGWSLASIVSVAGARGFLKAEQARLNKIDRMIERAWWRIEREINPPPPPPEGYLNQMAAAQQASNAYQLGMMNSPYGNTLRQQHMGGLMGATYGGLGLFGL